MMDGYDLVRRMLHIIGEDPAREGLCDTPARVVRSWGELFAGYGEDPAAHLEKQFATDSSQMVHVNGIEFFSTCEHHLLPFYGTVDIAYIPTDRVVGISKFARVVDGYARRLQIQERLANQIAAAVVAKVPTALGVGVRIRARHFCLVARGAKSPGASVTTSTLRGRFLADPNVKSEWISGLPD